MGVGFGDYNNDGHFDLYITVLGPNPLYKNEGTGRFTRMLAEPQYADDRGMGWGTTWFDYDNNGFLDLYVANQSNFSPTLPNVLYRNSGNGTFSIPDNSAGTASMGSSYGSACADINNDGFLDLFVTNDRDADELYLNSGGSNNWLQVRLIGTTSNRDAVGARVRVDTGGLTCHSEVSAGGGFISQNSFVQHFGLADYAKIDTLTIRWPGGRIEQYLNIQANQRVIVTENGGIVTAVHESESSEEMPAGFALHPNYPNPFNPSTTIRIEVGGQAPQPVHVAVYDVTGKWLTTLANRPLSPGEHQIRWDGRGANGIHSGSGIYLVKMTAPHFQSTHKMTLLK
ncbi:MAG: FG-GAP-like repeat-containing protein, partial [bacterium]